MVTHDPCIQTLLTKYNIFYLLVLIQEKQQATEKGRRGLKERWVLAGPKKGSEKKGSEAKLPR